MPLSLIKGTYNNIVIFGGSFNPPHIGHTELIKRINETTKTDLFLIIPCYLQPLKNIKLAKLELAFDKTEFRKINIKINDYEIKKQGKSYTIDTLKHIKSLYKNSSINFAMGEDSWGTFNKWKNYKEILDISSITIVSRKNSYHTKTKIKNISFIDNFDINISSSQIRIALKKNDKNILNKYLDKNVLKHIQENRLFC